jgi:pimeloyl-ACP methyl ester carboxylesterase
MTEQATRTFTHGPFTGEITGSGHPLLLLHGLASSRRIWDLVVPLLNDRFTVVTVDLPGHGASDTHDGPHDFASLRHALIDLIHHLGLERPVVVGHSWGASVALEIAAGDLPLSHLVLVDGGYSAYRLLPQMTWELLREHLSPPHLDVPEADYLTMLREAFGTRWRPEFEPILLANMRTTDGALSARLPRPSHLAILEAMWEQDLPALYQRITVPTLLIVAGLDGPGTLDWHALKELALPLLHEHFAGPLQVITMPETVHDVPLQRPRELANAIREFVT